MHRQARAAGNDPREVAVDAHARYFGTELEEHSVVAVGEARLSGTRLEEWLHQAVARCAHAAR